MWWIAAKSRFHPSTIHVHAFGLVKSLCYSHLMKRHNDLYCMYFWYNVGQLIVVRLDSDQLYYIRSFSKLEIAVIDNRITAGIQFNDLLEPSVHYSPLYHLLSRM